MLLLLVLSYNVFNLRERFFPVRVPSGEKSVRVREKVVRVKDGDTVVISSGLGGKDYTCRLYGIDSPETAKGKTPGQSYGDDATKALQHLVLGKEVEVTLTGGKTYNREVCILRLNDVDINLKMIELGYAWAYKQYLKPPYMETYMDAQRQARVEHAGLWHDPNPEPPWDFRHLLKHRAK